DLTWIVPVSYWYPPCFWQDPNRFSNATAVRNICTTSAPYNIRRNRVSDVITPSGKVLLFERNDFYNKGKDGVAPMWNTIKAKTQVACTDGSGKSVNMADVIGATSTTSGLTPSTGRTLLQPAGFWGTTFGPPQSDAEF